MKFVATLPALTAEYKPRFGQAAHIIAKFGGERLLAEALGVSRVSVYRWSYPRHRGGSEGLIPTRRMEEIQKAARLAGILLNAEDLSPRQLGRDA